MKTHLITNVKVITRTAKPVVVLELQGHEAIVRNLDQMLIDLQNSGMALNVSNTSAPAFTRACIALRGGTVSGDYRAFKAGDTFTISEGHPLVKSGDAKVGDKRKAENDGVWVEGFLSLELSIMKQQVQANAEAYVDWQASFSAGFASITGTPATSGGFTPETDENPEPEVVKEALGKAGK